MAEKVVRTRQITLHRLWRKPKNADKLFDVLDHEQLDELDDLDFGPVTVSGCSGLGAGLVSHKVRRVGRGVLGSLSHAQPHCAFRRHPLRRPAPADC
ncbi:hypothetical protein [Kribbella sp. NPDC050459]|uniref:hypothetical protein n=1 Tax=Kribbella sp. NPDC050459 TaxID=3155785 RepID=UPI0033E125A3